MKQNLKQIYYKPVCVEIKPFLIITNTMEETKLSQTTSCYSLFYDSITEQEKVQ